MLELVDRSHQAGVAFLDQVQEAQAAIAILLGDRHDQPQIASRQPSFGGVVSVLVLYGRLNPTLQRRRTLERDPHQVTQFFLQLVHRRVLDAAVPLGFPNLPLQRLHPLADFTEFLEQRLQAIGSQIHLFDQPHGLVATTDQAAPGGATLYGRERRLIAMRKSRWLRRSRWRNVCRLGPKRFMMLRLGAGVGHRHLDRPVQSQLAVAHLLQCLYGTLQNKVGRQHAVAVTSSRLLDLLGRIDFLDSLQQRNLAHLHQVHANRIIRVVNGTARGPSLRSTASHGVVFEFVVHKVIGETRSAGVQRR